LAGCSGLQCSGPPRSLPGSPTSHSRSDPAAPLIIPATRLQRNGCQTCSLGPFLFFRDLFCMAKWGGRAHHIQSVSPFRQTFSILVKCFSSCSRGHRHAVGFLVRSPWAEICAVEVGYRVGRNLGAARPQRRPAPTEKKRQGTGCTQRSAPHPLKKNGSAQRSTPQRPAPTEKKKIVPCR
jgi:hypothetical protein